MMNYPKKPMYNKYMFTMEGAWYLYINMYYKALKKNIFLIFNRFLEIRMQMVFIVENVMAE